MQPGDCFATSSIDMMQEDSSATSCTDMMQEDCFATSSIDMIQAIVFLDMTCLWCTLCSSYMEIKHRGCQLAFAYLPVSLSAHQEHGSTIAPGDDMCKQWCLCACQLGYGCHACHLRNSQPDLQALPLKLFNIEHIRVCRVLVRLFMCLAAGGIQCSTLISLLQSPITMPALPTFPRYILLFRQSGGLCDLPLSVVCCLLLISYTALGLRSNIASLVALSAQQFATMRQYQHSAVALVHVEVCRFV